jgi:hypothetical protein
MSLRVIQWATGNVGRAAIQGISSHPELELVGTWVHSEAKEGRDVGELCGLAPLGLRATRDIDALLAMDADCILYSPVMAEPELVVRMLEAGKNVVTPLGWFYPFHSQGGGPGVAEIEAACRRGGVSLHGTGIHPGGITERFPLTVSALCSEITHVRAEEFSDIRTYLAEFVVREVMLFGKTPEQAEKSPMLAMLGHGFNQSIDMVADAMGFDLDADKRATHEMAVATERIETPVGPIEPGTVAAQRFTWEGLVRGEPVVTVRVNWLMGEEHLEPAWSFGPERERFEVEIVGDPGVHLTFRGLHPSSLEEGIERNKGIVVTAMHCVNAIPAVCRAEPGIRTYLDLPLMSGTAHPRLRADRAPML